MEECLDFFLNLKEESVNEQRRVMLKKKSEEVEMIFTCLSNDACIVLSPWAVKPSEVSLVILLSCPAGVLNAEGSYSPDTERISYNNKFTRVEVCR
ncbi:hypothetical protein RIF29_16189 [Crotalaria pallida]|uniref:Uncharacterized protein n=1 Tax=Crotalaria pallida TaxID=3830 RepID=A0AAN9FEM9_CROPI